MFETNKDLFEREDKFEKRVFSVALFFWALWALLWLALIVGGVFVGIHFLAKVW